LTIASWHLLMKGLFSYKTVSQWVQHNTVRATIRYTVWYGCERTGRLNNGTYEKSSPPPHTLVSREHRADALRQLKLDQIRPGAANKNDLAGHFRNTLRPLRQHIQFILVFCPSAKKFEVNIFNRIDNYHKISFGVC
jgi:hypothetical protein